MRKSKPPFLKQKQYYPGLDKLMTPLADHGETSYVGSGTLDGRRALITGGDSGIGRAIVIAFAREGAKVVINYLEEEQEDADDLVYLLSKENIKINTIPGDITNENFCKYLIDSAVKTMNGIDILVNNAGRQIAVDNILKVTTNDFDEIFKTNVYAMFWLCKYSIPYMGKNSVIINTASGQANNPSSDLLAYSSSKGAVVTFTKCLARQLTKKGIRVNTVCPGPFWTPLQPSGGQLSKNLLKFGSDTPLGRPGQPVEISPIYVLLANKNSTFSSGCVWNCDGGKGEM